MVSSSTKVRNEGRGGGGGMGEREGTFFRKNIFQNGLGGM